MLRIAITGCGKIADDHASQIKRVNNCSLVAACDPEPLMVKQFAERFEVTHQFTELDELLANAKPDVVHITTPPQSHYRLAKMCLSYGAHVYVEKPFTVTVAEAEDLISTAQNSNLRITVGHDDQFSHAARQMRSLVATGYLGGPPAHIESHYGYDLVSSPYAKALLGDRDHWVRHLPGGLLQNTISHGIARIAEFLPSDKPTVVVNAFVSPQLRRRSEGHIFDELRVIINANDEVTAYFTFSSEMRPSLHQLRLYGHRNGLMLDEDQQIVLRLPGQRRKSYLEKLVSPIESGLRLVHGGVTNTGRFLRRDFHVKSGMNFLITAFYESIRSAQPLPIPYFEILRVSRIMDAIFSRIAADSGG